MFKVWLHKLSNRLWKSVSFHIRAGMLSGPNALDDLRFFTANFNSVMVKFEVQILRVSEILTLGSVLSAGRVAFLPRRFLKWLEKFSIRFSAEPLLILIDVLEFLPARSLMVFQARWYLPVPVESSVDARRHQGVELTCFRINSANSCFDWVILLA